MWPFDDEDETNQSLAPKAAPTLAVPAPIDPMVRDYLVKKNGLEQNVEQKDPLAEFSVARRKAIEAENEEDRAGPNWLAGLASFGAGLQGKDALAAGQSFLKNQEDRRQGKLDTFDKNRLLAVQESENDPNSPESKHAQELAIKMGMSPDKAASLTAAKFKEVAPILSKNYAVDEGIKVRQETAADRAAMIAETKRQAAEYRAERDAEKKAREEEKRLEKEQGLKTPYGLANTVDDAKQLKEAYESKKNFDSKIDEMIALRTKHGGGALLNREDVERGEQLSKDLLLEYKNMAKLGVLSKSDENIINAIIPKDPLAFKFAGAMGQDPIMNNLKSFKKDSDNDFKTKVATRTRNGLAKSNEITGNMNPPPKKTVVKQFTSKSNPGKTKVVYDDGTEEIVDSAVANNGR